MPISLYDSSAAGKLTLYDGEPEDKFTGFINSTASAMLPELLGRKPSREVQQFRARYPGLGLTSELVGMGATFGAGGVGLLKIPQAARLIGGARALAGVSRPALGTALAWGTEAGLLEAGRVAAAVSPLGDTLTGRERDTSLLGLAGESALNVGGGLALGGAVGLIGSKIAKGVKIADLVPGATPDRSPTEQLRAITEAVTRHDEGLVKYNDDQLKRLRQQQEKLTNAVLNDVDPLYGDTGDVILTGSASRIDRGKPFREFRDEVAQKAGRLTTDSWLNRWVGNWKKNTLNQPVEAKLLVKSERFGFANDADLQNVLDQTGMTQDEFARAVIDARVLRVKTGADPKLSAQRAAQAEERLITGKDTPFKYIEGGWHGAQEKSGAWVLVKKVAGDEPDLRFNQELDQVEADVRNQLRAAGVGKGESAANAKLWKAYIGARAKTKQDNPFSTYRQIGLSIQKGRPQDAAKQLPDDVFAAFGSLGADNGPHAFGTAERMAQGGASNEDIWKMTGWFKGDDGNWRFEIDDFDAKLDDKTDEILNASLLDNDPARVVEILKHDNLFQYYPELKDVKVKYDPELEARSGYFSPSKNMVVLSPKSTPEENLSVLMHELMHTIQGLENLARGKAFKTVRTDVPHRWAQAANEVRAGKITQKEVVGMYADGYGVQRAKEEFANYKRMADQYKRILAKNVDTWSLQERDLIERADKYFDEMADFVAYRRSAGEVEARNVQNRLGMGWKAREKSFPGKTIDVPQEKIYINTRWGAERISDWDTPTPVGASVDLRDEYSAMVSLFKHRDKASFMHESAHIWFRQLVKDADEGDVAAAQDLSAVTRWLGSDIPVDDNGWMKLRRDQQERFAVAFEKYLSEGRAPTRDLAGVFNQFRKWMLELWRHVAPEVQDLPDDVRAVFDRMLKFEQEVSAKAGDQYLVVRTDEPGRFVQSSQLTADAINRSAYYPKPEETARIGEATWDVAEAFFKENGRTLVDLMQKRKGTKSGAVALAQELTATAGQYLAPTQPLGTTNVKLNFALQLLKRLEAHVETRVDRILYGERKLDLSKSPLANAVTLDPPRTHGLADEINTLTAEQLNEVKAVLELEIPIEAVRDLNQRGQISEEVVNILQRLEDLGQEWSTRVDKIGRTVQTDDAGRLLKDFSLRRGHYGLSRQYPGSVKLLLEDEAGNVVGVASETSPAAAHAIADDIIEQQAKSGKNLRKGAMLDDTLKDDLQWQRIRASVLRPGFLKSRGELIGYEYMRGEFTADKFIKLLDRNIRRREGYIRDIVGYEKTFELKMQLKNEDRRGYDILEKRLRLLQGDEGVFGTAQNAIVDKLTLGMFGKDSASMIVRNTQRLLNTFQMTFGNLAQPVLNMTSVAQVLLPEVAYVVNAAPETLARNYVTLPLHDGSNRLVGTLGVLSEFKILGNAIKRISTPLAKQPEFDELLKEMIRQKVLAPRYAEEQFGANGALLKDIKNSWKDGKSFIKTANAANEILLSKSEEINRLVGISTAYELGKLMGLKGDRLANFTREMLGKTAFNYGTFDRATVFTTPLGSLMGTFKNWMFHYVGNMVKYSTGGRETLPALLWQTAATGAIGGLAAMPVIHPLAEGASKLLGDQSLMESLYGSLFEDDRRAADMTMYGLPSALGVSLSSQVAGFGADPERDASMLFGFAAWDRVRALSAGVKDALAAYAATGESPFEDEQVRNQLIRGLAPRTMFRAMAAATEGSVKSMSTGYKVLDEVSPGTSALYAAGFNPMELEKTYEVYGEIRKDQNKKRELVSQYGQTLAQAWKNKDYDLANEVFARALATGTDTSSVLRSAQARTKRAGETQLEFIEADSTLDELVFE